MPVRLLRLRQDPMAPMVEAGAMETGRSGTADGPVPGGAHHGSGRTRITTTPGVDALSDRRMRHRLFQNSYLILFKDGTCFMTQGLAVMNEMCSMARVAQELRSQCAVLDYGKKDFSSSTAYKNSGFLGDIPKENSDLEADDGNALTEDLDDDEQALWGEAENEAQEAMATLQLVKNTLKQARLKQSNVRLARQYYKGKGKGNRESGKGSDDSRLTCLRCGKVGHRAANCPEPAAQAKVATETDATSSFICFNEIQQALAAGISTADAARQGKAVIDGGATRTLASVAAMEHIMAINAQKKGNNGILGVNLQERPTFGFGNGSENHCASTIQLQVQANDRAGELKVHCLDRGSGPLLLSVEALRKLKAVIDFDADLICFRALDDKKLIQAERSQTGHQLLPVTEDLYSQALTATRAIPGLGDFVNI